MLQQDCFHYTNLLFSINILFIRLMLNCIFYCHKAHIQFLLKIKYFVYIIINLFNIVNLLYFITGLIYFLSTLVIIFFYFPLKFLTDFLQ
jgi:hypothetical protein